MPSAAAAEVVTTAGVDPTPAAVAQADAYLARRRRGRWLGLAIGLVAGFGPLAGDSGISLAVPRLMAGYLLGLLMSESLVRAPARRQVRAATLRQRSAADVLPRAARLLPWLTLTPLLAAPVLAIGWHPRGRSHVVSSLGSCSGTAYWPRTATLAAVAGIAALALVATASTLRQLARRAQPAEDPDALTLDLSLRARSARATVAASSALGLALLALVGASVYQGLHSFVCAGPLDDAAGGLGNVYSWAPSVASWLQGLDEALLVAAVLVWVGCRRLPVPPGGEPSQR